MVFLMALFAALLGLSIPIAAGALVDQVIPAADRSGLLAMCAFPGSADVLGGGVPGDSRALGAANRRAGIGDDDPGGVGPAAAAAHGFLREIQLGRPGFPGDGIQQGFQESLRGSGDHAGDGALCAVQPGPAFLL